MDCFLARDLDMCLQDGIFGHLLKDDKSIFCHTIERAYLQAGLYVPKLAAGSYTCERYFSPHFGYEVFRLLNVPPFQGAAVTFIEIHIANTESDLIGCIGLGEALGHLKGVDAVLQSRHAFERFMQLQKGVNTFRLTVT